jgi:hypothetical protein
MRDPPHLDSLAKQTEAIGHMIAILTPIGYPRYSNESSLLNSPLYNAPQPATPNPFTLALEPQNTQAPT